MTLLDRRSLVAAGLSMGIGGRTWALPRPADDLSQYPAIEGATDDRLSIRDDLGAGMVVATPMRRVAVFNRYTAEFVRALAGAGVIAGVGSDVIRERDYWPNLRATIVGQGQTSPNYEAIVALRPDAVFFPRNSEWETARRVLAPFDIAVVVVTAWDLVKHERNVTFLGRLLERADRAAQLNAFYAKFRDLLRERTAGASPKRVYFEEVGNYKTVLRGSGWHDMIGSAGGRNIFDDVDGFGQPSSRGSNQAFDVDPEDILSRRPEVIIKLQPSQYAPHTRAFCAGVLSAVASRPGFAKLPAVQSGNVYSMSYYLAGGCSKIIGALQIAKWLHPDRFADADPGDAMRTWLEDFQDVKYPGHYWMALGDIRP